MLSLKLELLNDSEGYAIPRESEVLVNGLKIGTYAPDKVEVISGNTIRTIEEVDYDKINGRIKFKSKKSES